MTKKKTNLYDLESYQYDAALHSTTLEIFDIVMAEADPESRRNYNTIRIKKSDLSFIVPNDEEIVDELTTSLYDRMDEYNSLHTSESGRKVQLDMYNLNADPIRVDGSTIYVRVARFN